MPIFRLKYLYFNLLINKDDNINKNEEIFFNTLMNKGHRTK